MSSSHAITKGPLALLFFLYSLTYVSHGSSIDMAYWGFLRKDYFLSTWADGFAFDRKMDFVGLMGRLGFGVAGSSKLLLMGWSGRVIVR